MRYFTTSLILTIIMSLIGSIVQSKDETVDYIKNVSMSISSIIIIVLAILAIQAENK